MTPIKDVVMLLMSLNALSRDYKDYGHVDYGVTEDDVDFLSTTVNTNVASNSRPDAKSLYDLLEHFPMDKDIECPESDSRFRYPGRCGQYITCRDFKAHVRSCPPGMFFDQKYSHCRLAFEVECENEPKLEYTCDRNEVYSDCGSPCEGTCDQLRSAIECENQCYEGCFCRMGYLRDSNGQCVKPEDCPNINSVLSFFGDQ